MEKEGILDYTSEAYQVPEDLLCFLGSCCMAFVDDVFHIMTLTNC